MDLLKLINATGQQDQLINTLAGQFGLSGDQAGGAVAGILGSLSDGMQQKAQQGGLAGLLSMAQNSNIQQYAEQPAQVTSAKQDGNEILGQIFGSKETSRSVASDVAEQSGVNADIIKQMLPMVAAMAMGSIGKQQSGSGSSDLTGMLTSFLDQDGDGSMMDDVMGMFAKK